MKGRSLMKTLLGALLATLMRFGMGMAMAQSEWPVYSDKCGGTDAYKYACGVPSADGGRRTVKVKPR